MLLKEQRTCTTQFFVNCRTLFSSASSSEAALERARTEAILNVSKWVKEHPRARPSEVQAKVEEEVAQFKIKIQGL